MTIMNELDTTLMSLEATKHQRAPRVSTKSTTQTKSMQNVFRKKKNQIDVILDRGKFNSSKTLTVVCLPVQSKISRE